MSELCSCGVSVSVCTWYSFKVQWSSFRSDVFDACCISFCQALVFVNTLPLICLHGL